MQSIVKYKPVYTFLGVIKGKYKIPILIYIKHKPRRYNSIKKKFPEASERIIIKQLKELIASGIIIQTVSGQKAPKISIYQLKYYGGTLCSIISTMWNWGEAHLNKKYTATKCSFLFS